MKILIAVDGSKHSDWAVDLLRRLPLSEAPEIVVIHVIPMDPVTVYLTTPPVSRGYDKAVQREVEKALAAGHELAARVADRLSARAEKVRTVIERGHAADLIITRAREERADLIILGSRGLSRIQSFLIGSVSQKVVTYAPCSVLIVKRKSRELKKILVALDGSKYSDKAVDYLQSHFLPEGIRCTALFAWEQPLPLYLPKMAVEEMQERFRRLLGRAGFKAKTLFVHGHPAKRIVEAAQKKKPDLVVVGSRGLTGLKRFLLGGISHKVVVYSPASVLVVRRSDGAEPGEGPQ